MKIKIDDGATVRVSIAPTITALWATLRARLGYSVALACSFVDEEGDRCTICNDSTLEEALRVAATSGKTLMIDVCTSTGHPDAAVGDGGSEGAAYVPPHARRGRGRGRMHGRSAASRREGQGARHRARFVKHVTCAPGTIVDPGASFLKTWRVRNTSTEPWPAAVQLMCVSRDAFGVTAPVPVTLPPLEPGAEADVTVPLVAPTETGSFEGHFRLLDAASDRRFGQRLSLSVLVESPSSGTPSDLDESEDAVAADGVDSDDHADSDSDDRAGVSHRERRGHRCGHRSRSHRHDPAEDDDEEDENEDDAAAAAGPGVCHRHRCHRHRAAATSPGARLDRLRARAMRMTAAIDKTRGRLETMERRRAEVQARIAMLEKVPPRGPTRHGGGRGRGRGGGDGEATAGSPGAASSRQ